MIRHVLARLAYMLPVIWLVVSVVFLLIHLVPGDPIQAMLGEGAAGADIQAARHAYGLDVPLPTQYVRYWKGVVHGDLGQSLRLNKPVKELVAQAYPATLMLALSALLVAVLLSIPAGVRSATRRNRWDDRTLSFVSLLGLSFPELRAWTHPDFALRHSAGLAAGLGLGKLAQSRASGGHHGRFAGGYSDSHGAHQHVGGVGPGLHPHCSRQGSYASAPSSIATRCATR